MGQASYNEIKIDNTYITIIGGLPMKITRHPENPIVVPGLYDWRKVTVFNPAVIIDNGKFYMIERTAGSLTPAKLPGSPGGADGVHFTHVLDRPVVTPDQLGFPTAVSRTRGSSRSTIPLSELCLTAMCHELLPDGSRHPETLDSRVSGRLGRRGRPLADALRDTDFPGSHSLGVPVRYNAAGYQ